MGEDAAEAPNVPATGRVLAGRYRVGRLLREGGMGSVYEGVHTETGRKVALKLVHLRSPVHEELENRFEREARIASNVKSKHIVQIFDAGRDAVLGPFMAMELLEGEDLETRLARCGALPPQTACEIAFQAARGLEKAHAANIAHRDLKPGNLFLVDSDEDGFLVKVLDFGIAKLFEGDLEGSARLTREGSALGTPLYMSPEQARGKSDIDARSDIYSLGAALYEAIVGRTHVPELANYNQLVIHIATVPAPRISAAMPGIDPRIDRLVSDMLLSDRRERIQTMRLVRERLATILGSSRARMGSIAEASGSFAQARPLDTMPPPRDSHAERTFRVASDTDPDDGEGIRFFDRASLSQAAAAPVPPADGEGPPDSENESVALFDRTSIRVALAEAHARTSSSSHVVDLASLPRSVPPPSIPAPAPAGAPPLPTGEAPRASGGRRVWAFAAIAAAIFVTLGSFRLASPDDARASAAAAAMPAAEVVPRPFTEPVAAPVFVAPIATDAGTETDAPAD